MVGSNATATSSTNPWDTSGHAGWAAHSQPSAASSSLPPDDPEGSGDNDFSDTALDAFLASLGDTTENGQGWVWPLFADSALEIDLGASNASGGASAPNALPQAFDHSPSAIPQNPPNNPNNYLPNKMVTAAAVLDHLPALYDVRSTL